MWVPTLKCNHHAVGSALYTMIHRDNTVLDYSSAGKDNAALTARNVGEAKFLTGPGPI